MRGYAYRPADRSAKEQLLAGLLVASGSQRISADSAVALAQRWMQEEGTGALQDIPLSRAPECWTQCQRANCDWRKSSCKLADGNGVQCTGRDNPVAGDEAEQKLLRFTIRKGFRGSLGLTTHQGGPLITSVTPGGHAQRAGLMVGDMIVELQNRPFMSLDLSQRMMIIRQASVVTLGVQRTSAASF